jgi:hypothetical protein
MVSRRKEGISSKGCHHTDEEHTDEERPKRSTEIIMAPVTSSDIQKALALKHVKDVCVFECKNGPTWTGSHKRLDAWVMLKTWSPPTTIGYEIKVSRHDFDQDQKWMGYLGLCNQFYFVCPAGLIKAVDLPKGIGLIWYSSSGKLHTKIKANRREVDKDEVNALMTYVLMSRTTVGKEPFCDDNGTPIVTKEDSYRLSVRMATERNKLADFIQGHIKEQFEVMKAKVSQADELHRDAVRLVERLAQAGVRWDVDDPQSYWTASRKIDELLGGQKAQQLRGDLIKTKRQIESLLSDLETAKPDDDGRTGGDLLPR